MFRSSTAPSDTRRASWSTSTTSLVGRSKRRRRRRVDDGSDGECSGNDDDDKLLRRDGRVIYFYCDVSRANVATLAVLLREACSVPTPAFGPNEVTLFIHSDGGDAYAGISGMQHIHRCRVPVTTVADGFCASAATLLLLGGATRKITPYTDVLIHQLSTAFWGKYQELRDEMANSTALMQSMREIYRKHTKLSDKKLQKYLDSELYMTCDECIKNQVVHSMF